MNLFSNIENISKEINEAIVMFSTGKDSIVTLDLCYNYLKKIVIIFLYYYKDLKYKNDILKFYENKYSQKIIKYPHYEIAKYYRNQIFGCKYKKLKLYKSIEYENNFRRLYNISYIAYGYRKSDSLGRRGIINKTENGIDKRNKKIYPIAEFTSKQIEYYIQKNKLKLPPEYKDGFRDINTFFTYDTLS